MIYQESVSTLTGPGKVDRNHRERRLQPESQRHVNASKILELVGKKLYSMRQLLSHRPASSATIGQWDTKSQGEMTYLVSIWGK